MKLVLRALVAFILADLDASAATHYVSPGSTNPMPPFSSWATAATNIQQALGAAATGDEVIVTNGVYPGGVAVTNALTLRSVNGPQLTVINARRTDRCISLADGVRLTGFTLTNGYGGSYDGDTGGVRCTSTNAFLTNCVIAGNSVGWGGRGGGASGGTLYNCTLTSNSAPVGYGGGASGSTLYNCTLTGNSATNGGGVEFCTLFNCTLTGNSAQIYGGGASGDFYGNPSMLYNCTLSGNYSADNGGGAAFATLYNCTVTGNSAYGGGGVIYCTLFNCTLTGNSAQTSGGGAEGGCGGYNPTTLNNCIVYFNTASYDANYDSCVILNYCCTTPNPGGTGNITDPPLFVDYSSGNLRLQSNSPCINAGNNAYVTTATDLDGRPRIVGGTVDMGAYEFQPGVSGEFIGWLQHYALPTDGSGDYIDSDSDGMNNWQEWVCATDPTNAASLLKMLSPTGGPSGTEVPWLSVTNRNYSLQRSTNLALQPSFLTVATNIAGQVGITTFTDTNAAGAGPFFYRVGVKSP